MNSIARAVLDAILAQHPFRCHQMVDPDTDFAGAQRSGDVRDLWAELRRSFPSIRSDTVEDFHLKNKGFVDASELYGDIPNVVFGNRKELRVIFGEGGWEQFDRTYPGTYGLSTISQPGFSADQRQALIVVGHQNHYMMGSGCYYLCELCNEWKVVGESTAWRC